MGGRRGSSVLVYNGGPGRAPGRGSEGRKSGGLCDPKVVVKKYEKYLNP